MSVNLTWRDRLSWRYLKHYVVQFTVATVTSLTLYYSTYWWLPDMIHRAGCWLFPGDGC